MQRLQIEELLIAIA